MKYYLGIDLSSSKTGICILDENENIVLSDLVKFDSKESLEKRATILKDYFSSLSKQYKIDRIFLEEPFVAIGGGGGSAWTTSIVHTFSGMCRYIVFKTFKKEARLVNVRSCRSKLEVKFPKGLKGKEVKQIVIDFVKSKYGDAFQYELTRQGNYVPGTDDRADAILLTLSSIRFFND